MKTKSFYLACFLAALVSIPLTVFSQGEATFNYVKSFPGIAEITGDDSGNIYIAGRFEGTAIQIGDFNLVSNGVHNGVYVARLDNSGNPVWATSFSSPYADFATTFLKYYSNKIYVGGSSN